MANWPALDEASADVDLVAAYRVTGLLDQGEGNYLLGTDLHNQMIIIVRAYPNCDDYHNKRKVERRVNAPGVKGS